MKFINILMLMILMVSCSTIEDFLSDDDEKKSHVLVQPEMVEMRSEQIWFNIPKRFSSYDNKGDLVDHLFFDYNPLISQEKNLINFISLTPADSQTYFRLDLSSGRSFREFNFCPQDDIWEKYDRTIDRPPFTDGIIPRVLDELAKPQRIIVFGRDKYYQEKVQRSHRVRVIGGVVEQYCKRSPCHGYSDWLSRLILVAVDPLDEELKYVQDMYQLKKKIDWDYTLAFLQNGYGRHQFSGQLFPAFRIIGESTKEEAMERVANNRHRFQNDGMGKMQKSCFKLYDSIWERIGKAKGEVFTKRFLNIHGYLRKKYLMCIQYVRPGNINVGRERLWFFSYLTSFFGLEELGHIYSCKKENWIHNPLLSSGKRQYKLQDKLKRCTYSQLNEGFYFTIITHANIARSNLPSYRFIEYDNSRYGSHEKLYSWIRTEGVRPSCLDEEKNKLNKVNNFFPRDINWRRRNRKTKHEIKKIDFKSKILIE